MGFYNRRYRDYIGDNIGFGNSGAASHDCRDGLLLQTPAGPLASGVLSDLQHSRDPLRSSLFCCLEL